MSRSADRHNSPRARSLLTPGLLTLGAVLLVIGLVLLSCGSPGGPAADAPQQPGSLSSLASPQDRAETPRIEAAPQAPTRHPAAGVPVRLGVPKLGVSTPVVRVKLGADGVLWPPSNPTLVGWWAAGAEPGAALGSALIVGHTVHTGGGVFDHLQGLRGGDPVRVTTRNGLIRYRVTSMRIYAKAALTRQAEKIFSQSVPGRLVLVSCTDWNGASYDSSVVVTAQPR